MLPNTKRTLSPEVINTLDSLWKLERIILDTLDFREVVQKVVDSILTELGYLNLGYKVVVLALVDEKTKTLNRVALSQTEGATKTRQVSELPFNEIKIPLSAKGNLCIKALKENKIQITHYFPDILTPPISVENAIRSQENAGIKASMVYPLESRGNTIGVMIFSMDKVEKDVSPQEWSLLRYFTELVSIAVQNSLLYTTLETKTEQIKKNNEKLLELDKTKDEFLSVASHELRTPMTIIKGYLWLLQNEKDGKLTKKQKETVTIAADTSERMTNLVNDMLNISRMERGKMDFKIEKVNIHEEISTIANDLQIKAQQQNIYLKVQPTKVVSWVFVDKNKLNEIIMNLVGNAFKFTKKGGIVIDIVGHTDEVRISVTDTGAGVAKEDQNKLFKKFERLDSSYQTVAEKGGTGLGLYITKQYVERMGGKLGMSSSGVGKGSVFWFTLPKHSIKKRKPKK